MKQKFKFTNCSKDRKMANCLAVLNLFTTFVGDN